ncbi:Shedu anti-phage system protein SduA domain-containing protein [Yoonia sp. R2331]|uniref:Shedu anti-phage system protein SduA domain-containing protein n=1 Tax=Yoonia sp. R2331 TaxID=3237238 RepID=UPI0034E3F8DE
MNHDLWTSIYELYVLLEDNVQHEDAYQQFFENNPAVFPVLGFTHFASFERKSGNKLPYDAEGDRQLEPDFICGNPEYQRITIFELKTPVDADATTALNNGNRVKFRAILESYISQVAEYCEFISGNADARTAVAGKLGMGGVSTVDGILVYGLNDSSQNPVLEKLSARRSPPLKIIAFDSLLIELVKAYSLGRNDLEPPQTNGSSQEIDGTTFVAHLYLREEQAHEKAYLIDIGNETANRLSIYIEKGRGFVEIIDNNGVQALSQWTPSYNKPLYLRVSVSGVNLENRSISVFVDNTEVEFRQSLNDVEFNLCLSDLFLGSDLQGQNGACFRLLENYIASKIMNWRDRIGSYRYFLRKSASATGCVEFNGSSFLYRSSVNGDMLQDKSEYAPIYKEAFTDPLWGRFCTSGANNGQVADNADLGT